MNDMCSENKRLKIEKFDTNKTDRSLDDEKKLRKHAKKIDEDVGVKIEDLKLQVERLECKMIRLKACYLSRNQIQKVR